MRLGLCFDGFYSIQEMVELARLAEDAGMESLWMSDHLCFRDSIASSMAFLTATRKIKVVPLPVSPYSRPPLLSAMAIATMDELAPGRVAMTVGTGNPMALDEAGIKVARPLKTVREYVEILRTFFRGEAVNFRGETFEIKGAKLGFALSGPIPIYLAAVKPRMLRLAGEIGDGALLSAGCAPGYIARCVAEIRAGASHAGTSAGHGEIAGFIATSVAPSTREALDASKSFLAYIFRAKHHAENIGMGGGRVDQEGLAAAIAKRDWEGARRFISDEVVFAHSVSGTLADCQKRVGDFIEKGLSLPVLLPMGTQEARRRVVELARRL